MKCNRSKENFENYGKRLQEIKYVLDKFIFENFHEYNLKYNKNNRKIKKCIDKQLNIFCNKYKQYLDEDYIINKNGLDYIKRSFNSVDVYIEQGYILQNIQEKINILLCDTSGPLNKTDIKYLSDLSYAVSALKFDFENQYLTEFPEGELLWGRLIS